MSYAMMIRAAERAEQNSAKYEEEAKLRKNRYEEVLRLYSEGKVAFEEQDLAGFYVSGRDLPGIILRRSDLRYLHGQWANLANAVLVGSVLDGADLRGADLRGASFVEASLRGVDLTGANLEGASLRRADLSRANLTGANLNKANLARSVLHKANLEKANFRRAHLLQVRWSLAKGAASANFEGANLTGAYPSLDDLRRLDFLRGAAKWTVKIGRAAMGVGRLFQ